MRGFCVHIGFRVCILSRACFGVLVIKWFSFLYGRLCITCFNNSAGELLLNKLEELCLYYELS